MQTLIRSGLALVLAWATLAADAGAVTLTEAMSAYRNNRVAEAEAMLNDVAADPSAPPEDRAGALRELGRIDWLVRGETDAAAAALSAAQDGEARCAALLIALRIYREAGAPQTALDEAARGRGECAPGAGEAMRVGLARAHLAAARLAPLQADRHVAAAAAELAAVGAPRAAAAAAARLSLALAERDAAAAIAAWRDYFWLGDADAPQAMASYAGRVATLFAAGLAPHAAEPDRIALVDLLIRAGFADDAAALAGAMSEAPAWRSARAYFAFRAAVDAATLRANRELAAGGEADWYIAGIQAALQTLARDGGLQVGPSEDAQQSMAAIAARYGLFGTIGETSGYPSLHAGHLVQDERLVVEQYGRRGELRFVVIDNMLANGFESWLWDGWAEAGGWSGDDLIVQVRSAYAGGPLSALRRARPGPARDRFIEAIERETGAERAALARSGVAELPSTSARLELQAIDQIAAATGGDEGAFIAEYWRATIQHSITLHEGRHALDKASGTFTGDELEFRAKLSEIALADYPRLALANIAGQTLGDTAHGLANRRLLEGYRSWIRRHRREIAGFDRSAPALAQLHLLSDAQIRAAARSVDSWAR